MGRQAVARRAQAKVLARRLRRPVNWLAGIFAAVLLIGAPTEAMAYLDPGTGSMLLQGLIAAVAAVATFASVFWQRVKGFFASLLGRKRGPDDDDTPPR